MMMLTGARRVRGCALALATAALSALTALAPAASAACPNDAVRTRADQALPDCRAYEQVSPVAKNGNDVGIGRFDQRTLVASADGARLAYESLGVFPGAESSTTVNTNFATRAGDGWTSRPISPARAPQPNADFATFGSFTPDLAFSIVRVPWGGSSLAPGDAPGNANLYLRDDVTGAYRTLNVTPPTGQVSPVSLIYAGASDDLRHILFESNDALTPDAPSPTQAFVNLYEWVDGTLRLVTILPDGTPAPNGGGAGMAGGASARSQSIVHAISADGRRIVFGTPIGAPPDDAQLYLRTDGQNTVEISASQRAAPDSTVSPPTFWGASADGTKIFFSSLVALTDDADPGNTNLYRYDVGTGTLTNLTVDANPANPGVAAVQGVIAMSADGSYVYFRDTTQYFPGQGTSGASNIYLWHDGTVRFVATDDYAAPTVTVDHLTVRATPDGRRLVLVSGAPLTSYDNTDKTTGNPDAEVYLYDADQNRLTCVSCRADGSRPTGAASLPEPPPRALRNLQRTITDDGRRVFFETRDALVPRDVNGKADVYAWEDDQARLITSGTSADDSYFGAASASGDDLFFVTREQLTASDDDQNLDVYDARVGGGLPAPAAPQPCDGDGCQGPPAAGPPPPAPSSPGVSGAGNLPVAKTPAASFRVAAVTSAGRRAAARRGTVTLSVRVSRGGILKVRATRRVGTRRSTVGTATVHALRAGTVQIRVRLSTHTRRVLAHHGKVRLSLRLTFSHVRTAKTIALELAR